MHVNPQFEVHDSNAEALDICGCTTDMFVLDTEAWVSATQSSNVFLSDSPLLAILLTMVLYLPTIIKVQNLTGTTKVVSPHGSYSVPLLTTQSGRAVNGP